MEDCIRILRCAAFIPGWQQADTTEELSADEEPSWLQLTTQRLKGFAELGLSSSSFQVTWLLFRFSGAVYCVHISRLFFFFTRSSLLLLILFFLLQGLNINHFPLVHHPFLDTDLSRHDAEH